VLASAALPTATARGVLTVYDDATYATESDDIKPMPDGPCRRGIPVRIGSPDVFALVDELVALHDEPVATATWLSHDLLAREVAGAGFSGLLGGLGGDELNAGEYEYFLFHFADLRAQGREADLAQEIDRWAEHHDHPIFRKNRAAAEEGMTRLVDLSVPGRCLPDRGRMLHYAAALTPEYRAGAGTVRAMLETPSSSYLKNRAYQDLTRETLPCCLRAEDRQTTAHELDHFLPFLDHRLVELLLPGARRPQDPRRRDEASAARGCPRDPSRGDAHPREEDRLECAGPRGGSPVPIASACSTSSTRNASATAASTTLRRPRG